MSMTTKKRASPAGLTMLEVIIASAILTVVLAMAYAILLSVSGTSARGHLSSNLETRGRDFLDRCKNDFYDARFNDNLNSGIMGIHDDNTQVHFQMALQQNTSGSVDYGFVGGPLKYDSTTKTSIYTNVNPPVVSATPPYYNWVDCSCVIRFEPELVLLEPLAGNPGLKQPSTTDTGAPKDWKPNRYASPVAALTPGTSFLPTLRLKQDINKDGSLTGVFVKGKIWKYIMPPGPRGGSGWPTALQPWPAGRPLISDAFGVEGLSDDVILAVDATGKYKGEVDGPTPVGQAQGKDWLFRYLKAEPLPATKYGNTDFVVTAFPQTTSVCMMVVVWHAVEDEAGKGNYILRKTWERIPFRISKLAGP